jgi:[ribosomal protein S18]-alanine N-acetyltransferase
LLQKTNEKPSVRINTFLPFLACLPLIEADITAVLALDQRCLGGLWSRSGYQRELESPYSDLQVIVASDSEATLRQRSTIGDGLADSEAAQLAAQDATQERHSAIILLGIGCLWAILEEAHITTLAIEPAYQGRKLGQLLLTDLLLHGQRRGLTRATLEVRAGNERALNLYRKFSFQEAGQRKRYYSDGENARILWRSGLQDPAFVGQIKVQQQVAIAHLAQHHAAKVVQANIGLIDTSKC